MPSQWLFHGTQFNGPLMNPIPKLLAYRYMVSDLIFMSIHGNKSIFIPQYGNQSHIDFGCGN